MNRSPIVLLHTDKPQSARDIVSSRHPDLRLYTCDTYAGFADTLSDSRAEVVYSVRFDGTPTFPRTAILKSDHVKWISVGGSGTDHLSPWDSKQLTVTNAAGVAADMMAEYVLGTVLSFRLNLRAFQRDQFRRHWSAGKVTPLAGQTALLIGVGHTGLAVARRLKAMDMRVVGIRANPLPADFLDSVSSADDLLAQLPGADVVVVAVPLLPATRSLLSTAEFKAMKSNAILVDVSRGGVVDSEAMVDALRAGVIEGAALDVFEQEPLPAEHPLWRMDNVIITPHCSSVYEGWEARSVEMFADNLHRYCNGLPLDRVVDPLRGY